MKVMVALDGSPSAEKAIDLVRWLGFCEEVILVHALNPVNLVYPLFAVDAALSFSPMVEKQMRIQGMRLLERSRARLAAPSRKVTTLLVDGPPADMVLDAARSERADLIVVGARGLGPIRESLLGSTSYGIVSRAPCPVVVVRGDCGPFAAVLLAVEGPEDADAIVHFLETQPFSSAVRMHVLTVVPVVGLIPELEIGCDPTLVHVELDASRRFAAGVADRIRSIGYQADHTVAMGSPASEILDRARALPVDGIVVGSHARSAPTRLFLGSVAHAVTHRAPCPVFVVRGTAVEHHDRRGTGMRRKEAVR